MSEQLGGYEEAKKHLDSCWCDDDNRIYLLEKLLEYRRQNNIFENGDLIVYKNDCENSMLFTVKNIRDNGYDYGNDWGWYGVISNSGVSFSFRHATDEEIKQGRRL